MNDAAPVPVNVPALAIERPEALAQAIENELPQSLAGRSKGLLDSINSFSVKDAGLAFDRFRSNSPEYLRYPQNRVVVLMIDEAQNLDLSSARTPEAKLLQWLHQGNHGLPLLPVLAGLAHLDSRLESAGISRLSVDSVHTLGCLSRRETLLSATLFFDYFGIPRSDFRCSWAETLYSLSEGWPVHLHHGFRALAANVANAELRLDAVDGNAFRREEARLRSKYYDERTSSLPIQLAARMLAGVGPSGTREDDADAIDAEREARSGGRALRMPDDLNADELFDRMVAKGLLQRIEFGENCVPVPSLESFVIAHSGSSLHLFSQAGKAEGVKRALARGKDPNGADISGRTPLHVAAECGWTEIVEMLLEAGADPEAADGRGRCPRELLPSYASAELKEILMPEKCLVRQFNETNWDLMNRRAATAPPAICEYLRRRRIKGNCQPTFSYSGEFYFMSASCNAPCLPLSSQDFDSVSSERLRSFPALGDDFRQDGGKRMPGNELLYLSAIHAYLVASAIFRFVRTWSPPTAIR